jgi:serine/threonine-protein kinase HipA
MRIKVWSGHREAGLLGDRRTHGSSFAYRPDLPGDYAVSLTMPIRLESWDVDYGIHPIFEMNLPEGALRERLRLAFAKATGSFDDLDLLAIVGRSQVGRLRYTGENEALDETVPFQSVDEILAGRRDGGLFQYLLDRFATYSGLSGVQPKLLIRDEEAAIAVPQATDRASIRGATHIVKFWEKEYPQLAANEFFCLRVAQRCGLDVPPFHLSDDGKALVVERFDLRADGSYAGVEDFCVLNGRRTDEKYRGSYESAVLKRFREFSSPEQVAEGAERLFILILLNCALRNGDAHLKNFAVIYDRAEADVKLAPVYDIVTTAAYLPADPMALTLNGSTRWPSAKQLRTFGEGRGIASVSRLTQLMSDIADAMADTAAEIRQRMREVPEFDEIGSRMLAAWEDGIRNSLGVSSPPPIQSAAGKMERAKGIEPSS